MLTDLLAAGVATAAVGLVGTPESTLWTDAVGEARPGVPVHPETRFDFASLTKPFTATLALVLDADGTLPLAARIREIWPEADPRLGRRTFDELLRHRSGLQGWAPFYHHAVRSREEVLGLLLGGSLLGARAETYSDLDYLLWGMTAERVTGRPLDELMRTRVLDPLGISAVEPFPGEVDDVAQSFMDTGKEADLAAKQGLTIPTLPPPPLGLPQDGNARYLLGVPGFRLAGHAGLFGRAEDLRLLAAEWLAPRRLLESGRVTAALTGGRTFALGWWRRTLRGSAGPALPSSSVGHTGFAGNSLWLDRERQAVYILLTTRIDPRCDMNRWRRRFHSWAARSYLR